jgi:protein-tyrosine phosphatase
MDWITDDILIGNYLDAQDLETLQREGVKSIIGLNGESYALPYGEHMITKIKVFDFVDGAGNDPDLFLTAVDTLQHYRRTRTRAPVFVHCHAGKSRSAVLVAVHLMRDENMSLSDAMKLIGSKRDIRITTGMQLALDFQLR